MTTMDALYAYAVIPATMPVPTTEQRVLPGVGLALVTQGPLSAIVSAVPRAPFTDAADAEATAARALGHHGVVSAAAATGPCLPLAYGALFSSCAPLGAWLAERSDRLCAALADLGRASEWTALVEEDEASHAAWLDDADAELSLLRATAQSAGAGTAYLLSRKLEKLRLARRSERLGAIVAEATRIVEASAPMLERRTGSGKAKLTTLVRNDHAAALGEAMAGLARRLSGTGIAVAFTGPWPAYGYARSIAAHE
jgi:hypothetical protein